MPVRALATVTLSGLSRATAADWIGLFAAGAGNDRCLAWRYTSSGTQLPGKKARMKGAYAFPMPSVPGAYEFRLFLNNTYRPAAASSPVTVVKPVYHVKLSASPETVPPEAKVTVMYRDMPPIPYREGGSWVGLYKAGESRDAGWQWTDGKANGSCRLTMPAAPGSYRFEIWGAGEKLATSNPILVSAPAGK